MFRTFVQSLLRPFGYYVRSSRHFGESHWADLSDLVSRRPSQAPVILDVGAHHGETLVVARAYFKNATIHCFEPDPASFRILSARANSMDNLKLHPCALGAAVDKAEFFRNSESMTNSLLPTSAESLHSDYGDLTVTNERIVVPVDTLDAFCQRESITWIDLLKTDCQGYDLKVMQGGNQMISGHHIGVIACEVIFDDEYDGQGSFHELLGFLDTHGYCFMGFYNTQRNRKQECTFCDAIFCLPAESTQG